MVPRWPPETIQRQGRSAEPRRFGDSATNSGLPALPTRVSHPLSTLLRMALSNVNHRPGVAPEPASWNCPVCGTDTPHTYRPGRKRVYCTNACRQRAYRWRRANGVRLLVTPWSPAGRSHNTRSHAVRPSADPVGRRHDRAGRRVAVCGAFARVASPERWGHTEFVPWSDRACRACTTLIGADPEWKEHYPIFSLDRHGYPTVYRSPEARRVPVSP